MDAPTDRGVTITGRQYRWEPRFSSSAYVAMYMDIAITNPEVTYDYDVGLTNVIDGIIRRINGAEMSRMLVQVVGHLATEVHATSARSKTSAVVRGFRHENRFYVLFMISKLGSDSNSARDRFFSSLRLL